MNRYQEMVMDLYHEPDDDVIIGTIDKEILVYMIFSKKSKLYSLVFSHCPMGSHTYALRDVRVCVSGVGVKIQKKVFFENSKFKIFARINFRESAIFKNFAWINFRERGPIREN